MAKKKTKDEKFKELLVNWCEDADKRIKRLEKKWKAKD